MDIEFYDRELKETAVRQCKSSDLPLPWHAPGEVKMADIGKDVSTKDGGAVKMADVAEEITERNSASTPQKQGNGTLAVKTIEKAAASRQAHINVADAALSLDSTLSNLSGSAGSAGGISSFLEHANTQRRMAVATGKIMRKSRSHAVSTDLQRWRKEMSERQRLERCKSRLVVAWLAWYDVYQTSKSNALKIYSSTIRWKKLLYAKTFRTWKEHTIAERKRAWTMYKIVTRWEKMQYAKAFGTWQEHTIAQRKLRVLSTRVVKRWKMKVAAMAWGKWWEEVRRSRVARKVILKWLMKTLQHGERGIQR